MSALDLFASAMGAFLLIAVMALPYYLKVDPELIAQVQVLEDMVKKLEEENKKQEEETKKKEEENQKLKNEKEQLEKQIENSVKFALLGITTKANSFIVVMDMSGSMEQYTDIMKKTVHQIMEPLTNKNKFQIIGYQGGNSGPDLHSWQTPYNIADMTPGNKTKADRFVSDMSQKYGGGTPTWKALDEALNYDADAIILLTDGAPDSKADKIINDITRKNSGKKEIHTVALGDYNSDKSLVDFLMELAKQNRGGFVGISK